MQDTNHFLKAALQVGPWRVTRRVLLFVVVFCLVVIVFGSLILKTHAFDTRDDDDDDWDDDDDDDDKSLSSGDSLMLVLMGLAGMAGLAACAGCLLATSNTPRPLGESGSVFTLSGVNTHQPVTPRPSAPESLPHQPENPLSTVPPSTPTVPPTPTKVVPQGNGYTHSPIFPRNPNYPAEPPPSYTAPSYPAGGRTAGRRMARTMPPNVSRVVSSPPTLHTVADLPPPYAPGHTQPQRR